MGYIDALGDIPNYILRKHFLLFFISYKMHKETYKVYCYEPVEREIIRRCIACL